MPRRGKPQLREVRRDLRALSVADLEDSLASLLDNLREHLHPDPSQRSGLEPAQRAALVGRIRQLIRLTDQRLTALENDERRVRETEAVENPSQHRAMRARAAARALAERQEQRRMEVLRATHHRPPAPARRHLLYTLQRRHQRP